MKNIRGQKRLRRIGRIVSVYSRRFVRWWVRNDRKYRVKWRIANGFAALVILASVVVPVAQDQITNRRYRLSQTTLDLVGKNNQALASKLTFNAKTQTYEFNKEAIKEFNPQEPSSMQIGGADDKTKPLYALEIPTDPKQGVTYHDVNSQLSFKLVPQFDSLPAKTEQGRIVLPVAGAQAVYTLKNNGLKEDIVVSRAKQDTMRFTYTLELPKSLEARQLPDGSGGIGIYSADSTLFTNMSYGSDKDKELVDKARENGAKTNLVFGIPAPVITAKDGKTGSAYARFELHDNKLEVVAEKLTSIEGTFSIDPSVTITSATDFEMGNEESNIDFTTAGQINRGSLTGGSFSSWATQTSLPASGAGSCGGSAQAYGIYNGYFYMVCNNTTAYAKLNTNGTINGSWLAGTAPPNVDVGKNGFIYNGYMYLTGGWSGSGADANTFYIKLNANGTMAASWTPGTNMTRSRFNHGAIAYNGYVYVSGGMIGLANNTNIVERAPINANGSLGTWVTTGVTNLNGSGRSEHQMEAYNGYMYVTGGLGGGGEVIEYAKINNDGTMGTWNTTTTIPTGSNNPYRRAGSGFHNGYWYLTGGCDGSCSATASQRTIFAPVYANGTLGSWQVSSNTFASQQSYPQFGVYNNYIFVLAGDSSNNTTAYSAPIDGPGSITSYACSGANCSFDSGTNNRQGMATVAVGGYVYLLGGNGASIYNSTRFAKINSDGSVGAWATTTNAFVDSRVETEAVVYGDKIYLMGGTNGGTTGTTDCTYNSGGQFYCGKVQVATVNLSTGQLTWSGTTYTYYTDNARAGVAATINNGYLYVIGGRYNNNSTESTEVNYAKVNDDGTLGTFAKTTSQLPIARSNGVGAVSWNNRIYVVGGSTTPSSIYTTPTSTGDITSWASTGNNLSLGGGSSGLTGAGVVGSNGYIYVTGGFASVNVLNTLTQIAKINNDGTLSNWTSSSQAFTTARYNHGSVAYNGNLYIFGGCNNGGCNNALNNVLKDVQYAAIGNGGGSSSLGWTTTNAAAYGSAAIGAIAYNGFLYEIGGCISTGCVSFSARNTVSHIALNPDGTIGATWTTDTVLPVTKAAFGLVAYGGNLYVIGGGGTGSTSDVYFATPNATNGNITSWTATSSLNLGRVYLSAFAYNGYMYALGGQQANTNTACNTVSSNVCSDVQYAVINEDGTLGGWHYTHNSTDDNTTFVSGFSTGRMNASAVVNNGYAYIAGGWDGTNPFADVQYAKLNSNGTIGAWSTTSRLSYARFISIGVAYNGYFYMYGGKYTSGSAAPTVESASFNTDGTLSDWRLSISPVTNNAASYTYGGGAVSNGYLYYLGGQSGISFSTEVAYSPLQVMSRVGRYSRLIDLGVENARINNFTYNGLLSNGVRDISYRTATTAAPAFTSSLTAPTSPDTACTAATAVKSRYVFVTIVFDDTTNSTFGDLTTSNTTDFTVRYNFIRPDPNMRLRLGQTLQQGDLSPFDTCGP